MARFSNQADVVQDERPVIVGEIDVSKLDAAFDGFGCPGIGPVADVWLGVEDVEDPLRRGCGSYDGVVDAGEALDGAIKTPEFWKANNVPMLSPPSMTWDPP